MPLESTLLDLAGKIMMVFLFTSLLVFILAKSLSATKKLRILTMADQFLEENSVSLRT